MKFNLKFNDIDEETMRQLQGMVAAEVRKINGIIDCEEAVRYQKN